MPPIPGSKKRNKSTINPKIHVKGISKVFDEEVDEVKAHTDSESEEDVSETRVSAQHVGRDSDDHESGDDDDDEKDDTKKIKKPFLTKEQKREQKMQAAKAKLNVKDKMERTIFVGNLPSNCEPKHLRKHFKQCGAIESVRLRGVIPSDPKIPKRAAVIKKKIHESCKSIFGYVVFWDRESVANALKLNTTKIGDNFITVQRSGVKTFDNDVTVFIGNLRLDVDENSVREFFDKCDTIQAVRLVRDSRTGVGKGFGFVSFATRDGVLLALEKNGAQFMGREIRVKKAGEHQEKRQKVDSKNARRRLREAKDGHKTKGSKRSFHGREEDDEAEEEAGEEAGDDEEEVKKQVRKEKRKKTGFAGERMGKIVKRKKKQKVLKVRQTTGQKKAIARILTT